MVYLDSSTIIYYKSFNPVCSIRQGWVAIVYYQRANSGGDGSSGSDGNGGSDNNNSSSGNGIIPNYNYSYQEQYINQQVITGYQHQENDQARIDAINTQLNTLNYWSDIIIDGDFYYIQAYGPDAKIAQPLLDELQFLRPAADIPIYEEQIVLNPNYYDIEQDATDKDIVTLNCRDRQATWYYGTFEIYGTCSGQYRAIPVRAQIAGVDFVYCGCGECEIECDNDCCLSLAGVAAMLAQLFS